MKGAKEMTDDELGEAILELAAPRARMAAPEDLRKITDMLAAFAVEAAGRVKERARPHAATSAIMRASAMVPFCRCGRPLWHHTDPDHVGDCLEYLPAGDGGALVGKVRNVRIDADGRLTCELEMPGAGARFLEQIKGGRS